MKNAIHTLKLLAAVLAAGLGACQDAAVEVYDASLNSLLRPSAVTAVAADSEHIAVSWRGSAGAFRLEYALNEDFAAMSPSSNPSRTTNTPSGSLRRPQLTISA